MPRKSLGEGPYALIYHRCGRIGNQVEFQRSCLRLVSSIVSRNQLDLLERRVWYMTEMSPHFARHACPDCPSLEAGSHGLWSPSSLVEVKHQTTDAAGPGGCLTEVDPDPVHILAS